MKVGPYEVDILSGGLLRLDGGTMFGPVPRVLWEKQARPDERHRVTLGTNCLLLRGEGRRILIDAGYGSKADPKRRDFQGLEEGNPIERSLNAVGVRPDEIDIVVLTHLHFDHVGGCTLRRPTGELDLVFPNAEHVVQRAEWEDATAKHPELLGSFFEEDFLPIETAGRLRLVDGEEQIAPDLRVRCVGGHTRGMQIVEIGDPSNGETFGVVLADLVPSTMHLRTFWHVAYDQFPLDVRRRKPIELGRIADAGGLAFFCHDTRTQWARLARDPRAEFVVLTAH